MSFEDLLRRLCSPLAHGVQEHADPAVPGVLVPPKYRLERFHDLAPREAEPGHEGGGDVDFRIPDPVAPESPDEIPRQKRVVGRGAQQAADVPVEKEKLLEVGVVKAGTDARHIRKDLWRSRARKTNEARMCGKRTSISRG